MYWSCRTYAPSVRTMVGLISFVHVNQPDHWGLGAGDSVCPVTPMFHANCWGLPYAAGMAGAKLVLLDRWVGDVGDAPLAALPNIDRIRLRSAALEGAALIGSALVLLLK